MRVPKLAAANLLLILAVAGSTLTATAGSRSSVFAGQATALEQRWEAMIRDGVPAAAIAPIRGSLQASGRGDSWWSPVWWTSTGARMMDRLTRRTDQAWTLSMASARVAAVVALARWGRTATVDAPYLSAAALSAATTWPAAVQAASTPAALTMLAASYNAASDAAAAQAQVTRAIAGATSFTAATSDLHALLLLADQAAAEGVPGAPGFLAGEARIGSDLHAGMDSASLFAVTAQIASLRDAVAAALNANQCGHAVPAGKVISINLTLQEVVFYQDGCALRAGPVTSGRPYMRTPTGTFHVFAKAAPIWFTSSWPRSSPNWYAPERSDFAMEFTVVRAGIFLHDAPWEPDAAYGPGSEDGASASHGCVHVQTSLMSWAYAWAPMGTPVIVSS